MKKDKWTMILYYGYLLLGLLGMIALIVSLEMGFEDNLRAFFDKLGVFTFVFIFGIVVLYIYGFTLIVSTKGFQKHEDKAERKRKKNEIRYKKIWKRVLRIWGVLEVPHIISVIYVLYCVRTGTIGKSWMAEAWAYSICTPIALWAMWLYYKGNYSNVKDEVK